MNSASYVDSHTMPGKGEQYERLYRADPWHRYLWTREQAVLRQLLRECLGGVPIDALDFACGTGRITVALEPQVRSVTGVDVSESMLEVARQKVRSATLYRGNLLSGPVFPPRTFNLITAFRFFVNAEPNLRLAALRTLETYLAPDGCFVFNNHQNLDSAYIQMTKAYAKWKGFRFANTLSMTECEELVATVGFEIVKVYPVAMLHLPRVHLPPALYRAADRVGDWSQRLARRAECPIIVARRRTR